MLYIPKVWEYVSLYIMQNPKVIFQRGQSWGSRCVRIAVAKALSTGNAKESSSRGLHKYSTEDQILWRCQDVPSLSPRPLGSMGPTPIIQALITFFCLQARAKAKAARCRSRWGVMKKAVVGCVVHPGWYNIHMYLCYIDVIDIVYK